MLAEMTKLRLTTKRFTGQGQPGSNDYTTIDFPIEGAEQATDPYILKAVDGLGPVEIDVNLERLPYGGPAGYYGRKPHPREVTALIRLNPDYSNGNNTPEALRQKLYGLMTPGDFHYSYAYAYEDAVQVQIMSGDVVIAHTYGYVRNMETSIFSKDPEVQIVIECASPYLDGVAPVTINTLDPYEIEFENQGTAPAGFYFEGVFSQDASNFRLYRSINPSTQYIEVVWPFLAGDTIMINTVYGQRSIKVRRITHTVTTYDLVDSLSDDSQWLFVNGGLNRFDFTPSNVNFTKLTYIPQYWGI